MPPLRQNKILCAMIVLNLSVGCGLVQDEPDRATVKNLTAQMRKGTSDPQALGEIRQTVRALSHMPKGRADVPLIVADLAWAASANPVPLARAEALKSAWLLDAQLDKDAWRVDETNAVDFTASTKRLEKLLLAADPGEDGEDLARWFSTYRFPVDQRQAAIDLAEAVATQALVRNDRIGEIFQAQAGPSAHHALVVTTVHLATDASPVVRQQALYSARNLPVSLATRLISDAVSYDSDTLVALSALESLETLLDKVPPVELAQILDLDTTRVDPAIRQAMANIKKGRL